MRTCLTTACVVIEDGEVGVTKSFGAIRDEPLPAGVAFVAPVVCQVETWNVKLPQRFKESIEAKLTAEQKAEQKTFELRQAEKDAEIEVARAEGAAKAQKIVRSTLSGSYLQYLWIKTLNENPNVIYVATEANMPVFRMRGDSGLK